VKNGDEFMYVIETERLGLRKWIDSDIAEFIEMNKDPMVMEHFPKLLADEETISFVDRINQHMSEKGFGLWALEIKETNEFAGFVGLSVPRFEADFMPCVEIGWRLAHKHWGKSYAQEAAKACIKYGFENLGLKEIVSFTALSNERSMNVMKKIGMRYIKDFEHPNVEVGHSLRKHVLYSIRREDSI
jgi:RimJ/RimL family protein N-acetyltransferase